MFLKDSFYIFVKRTIVEIGKQKVESNKCYHGSNNMLFPSLRCISALIRVYF